MNQRYFEINENGCNIRCKLYYQELRQIQKAVVFCHGFGGHKDNGAAEKFAERMLSKNKGTALVTFNWPCHGDDVRKKLCLADCDSYLALVVEYVRSVLGAEDICCYATSFGGYLTLKYISEHGSPFRRIALRCPAVNMYEALTTAIITGDEAEKLRKGKDTAVGFDRKIPVSAEFLKALEENDIRQRDFIDYAEDILILHGTADEIIPFREAFAFADSQLMEFLRVEGADHRFRTPGTMEQAMKGILHFYGWKA